MGRSRGTLYFTVFAAFYVKPCSENHVKYGARGAFTVHSAMVAWFFTVFAALYVEPCSESRVKMCKIRGPMRNMKKMVARMPVFYGVCGTLC